MLGALVGLVASALLMACGPPSEWHGAGDAKTRASSVPAAPHPGLDAPATHGGVLSGGAVSEAEWERAIAGARAATYEVHNRGCDYNATGTAVAVAPRTLLTNRHVVRGARTIKVAAASGREVPVQEWEVSTADDLALLHLMSGTVPDVLPLASSPAVAGDLVAALGYPLGGPLKVGRGRVVDMDDLGTGQLMIRASMEVLPGNSGGPLVNTSSELVGLVRAIDLHEGWALAVPGDRVLRALAGEDLRAGIPCT